MIKSVVETEYLNRHKENIKWLEPNGFKIVGFLRDCFDGYKSITYRKIESDHEIWINLYFNKETSSRIFFKDTFNFRQEVTAAKEELEEKLDESTKEKLKAKSCELENLLKLPPEVQSRDFFRYDYDESEGDEVSVRLAKNYRLLVVRGKRTAEETYRLAEKTIKIVGII